MTGTLRYDAEASRLIEATYTTADVVEQRRVVRQALALRPGEHVIDIGTGPGLLAAELAVAAGPDGLICGIDISASMLALAGARAGTLRPAAPRSSWARPARSGCPMPRPASTWPSALRSWSTSRTWLARWSRSGGCCC